MIQQIDHVGARGDQDNSWHVNGSPRLPTATSHDGRTTGLGL